MNFLPDRALDHLRHVTESPDFSETRYQVEDEIGRGGMGTVYRAWDAQLERRVALKVMDAGYAINQEAKLLAQLEHPGTRAGLRCRHPARWPHLLRHAADSRPAAG